MAAWEYHIALHMHETKIIGQRARLGVSSAITNEHFLYNSIRSWAQSDEPVYEDYCKLFDLNQTNSCQEFMTFTLVETIEYLE